MTDYHDDPAADDVDSARSQFPVLAPAFTALALVRLQRREVELRRKLAIGLALGLLAGACIGASAAWYLLAYRPAATGDVRPHASRV